MINEQTKECNPVVAISYLVQQHKKEILNSYTDLT